MAQRPAELKRTWLALSESTDPALSLSALRRAYHDILEAQAATDQRVSEELVAVFDLIERDVARTFGGSGRFDTQASRDSLRRILAAYALYDEEVRYVQGMNFLTGFMLMALGEPDAPLDSVGEADVFALLVRLMRGPGYDMRRFFLPDMPGVPIMSHVITHILRAHLPHVGAHLEAVGVDPVFLLEYYLTLFSYMLPPPLCAGVWTLFWADGWSAVLKVLVVLLGHAWPHMRGRDFSGTVAAVKAYQHDRLRTDFPGAMGTTTTTTSAAADDSPSGSEAGSQSAAGCGSDGGCARAPSPASFVTEGLLRWLESAPLPAAVQSALPSSAGEARAALVGRVASLAGPGAGAKLGSVLDRVGEAAAVGGSFFASVLDRWLPPPPAPTAATSSGGARALAAAPLGGTGRHAHPLAIVEDDVWPASPSSGPVGALSKEALPSAGGAATSPRAGPPVAASLPLQASSAGAGGALSVPVPHSESDSGSGVVMLEGARRYSDADVFPDYFPVPPPPPQEQPLAGEEEEEGDGDATPNSGSQGAVAPEAAAGSDASWEHISSSPQEGGGVGDGGGGGGDVVIDEGRPEAAHSRGGGRVTSPSASVSLAGHGLDSESSGTDTPPATTSPAQPPPTAHPTAPSSSSSSVSSRGTHAVLVLCPPPDLLERARGVGITRAEFEQLQAEAQRAADNERRRRRAEAIRRQSLTAQPPGAAQ